MLRTITAASMFWVAAAAAAQTPPEPDVAITATVRARELRFEKVPKITVTFPGQNANVWKSDRTNLPDQVQPYVTYRDIGIRLTITTTLRDIEKILDEALAEPVSEPVADTPATTKSKR